VSYWGLYAAQRDDPAMCMGYHSEYPITQDDVEEYRRVHGLPEETWRVTVSTYPGNIDGTPVGDPTKEPVPYE